MLSDKAKALFAKLKMEYPAVAIKFCYSRPEGIEQMEGELSFCQFAKKCQDEGSTFYISKENDNCSGKYVLGMAPRSAEEISGEHGYELGVFRSPAPNARIHSSYPLMPQETVRYVIFSPVSECKFDPDLVYCVSSTPKAQLLMRASSYISGDLWESRTSFVVSCAWMFVYPYISGKLNFTVTGMHLGMCKREVYPAGLHITVIPYQKLDEVVTALGEMRWPLPHQPDEE